MDVPKYRTLLGKIQHHEQCQLVRTTTDLLEQAYIDALEAIMVTEDRTWKKMADSLIGLENKHLNIAGAVSPPNFSDLVQTLNSWGATPQYALIASDVWSDFVRNEAWSTIIDPVSQNELLLTGRLGIIHGVELISDQFRHQNHKVLDSGDVYIISTPEMHGQYTDRGGVEAIPTDITTQRIPGRGWVLNELMSMIIPNARSVARAKRVL
jgi:hypothetical protein